MAEILFIRLASDADGAIPWLITNYDRSEIIASGELANAIQLADLSEKARQRKVITFVPASDVAIKALNVPAKSQRAMRLAAPYMLEDDLAHEVEDLFFAYSHLKATDGNNCLLAAVERKQFALWQAWLSAAEIIAEQFIPDALALPFNDETTTVMQLGAQVLLKQGVWQAKTFDLDTWQYFISFELNQTEEQMLKLQALSPVEAVPGIELDEALAELPLLALAQNSDQAGINLLQGEFQAKKKQTNFYKHWRFAASLALIAFFVNLAGKGAEFYQLSDKQAVIESEIVASYKQAFPEAKRVSVGTVRSLLKRKMAELGDNEQEELFLAMVSKLQPAFATVSDLKPETVKFDGKRKEIRIQAVASNYQAFESFKAELEKLNLTVSQGSQNNQGDQVVGSFSIKEGA